MRYRIRLVSDQIYIVDTTTMRFWPEGWPANRGWLGMFPRMNPESQDFCGKVVEVLGEAQP
jgi:hypothetical protein